MWTPDTGLGLVIAIGLALLVVWAVFATGTGVFLVLALLTAVVLYLLYTLAVGGHQRFRDWIAGRN